MNQQIECFYRLWSDKQLEDKDLISELKEIEGKDSEITERFYRDLEFGTGGLRGVIGVGTNRMNIYTVGKATQGYSGYLNSKFSNPSVAIAYDSRIKSDVFAVRAAEIFAANGIRVHLYKELMPTPALSFAVRFLGCSGGIVITASHNPSKYNGYKVYGCDGGQITNEAADEILSEIGRIDPFEDVKRIPFEQGLEQNLISYITEDTISSYIRAVSSESLCEDGIDKNVSIVYTPLNGAGLGCVTRTLKENGFTNLTVVSEQENPDGNFPTCPYPNPEMKEALSLGIEYAKRLGSDLLLATDPDCDRVGTAVKSGDGYVLLSGNEMGMLLFDYICKRRIAMDKMPAKPVAVKTIVTTDMLQKIAEDYGVLVIDVLTGFKYIGEQIGLLEDQGEGERYIFGFEESYGYLSGGYVRDKDGVNASLLICEMFAYYKAHNQSLIEVMNGLYKKYGYCLNTLRSYQFEGAEGFHRMNRIMEALREDMPSDILGLKVAAIYDYQEKFKVYPDGKKKPILGLPKSNVLKIILEGSVSFVMRPSGTEPKLKIYLSVSAENSKLSVELEQKLAREIEKKYIGLHIH